MTMKIVSTITVGAGGVASISFTGIPQTGTDLYLIGSLRTTGASQTDNFAMAINTLTTGRTTRTLIGQGGSTTSTTLTNTTIGNAPGSGATANIFNNFTAYLPNYASAMGKTYSVDAVNDYNAASGSYKSIYAGAWASTAAITSLQFTAVGGNLAQYSTISLYTVSNSGATGATVA